MAIFNEILVGRFNRGLQKLFAVKGSPPVRQLGGEIMPIHPLFSGTENRYLEGWNRFAYVSQPGAQAGVQAASRLRNLANSNIIAVMERLLFTSPAGADFPILQSQQTNADLSIVAFSPNARWDSRGNPASALVRSESAGVPAPGLGSKMQGASLVGTSFDFIIDTIHELPLLPGDAIQMQSNVANTNPIFTFVWRERFLEESERS